MNNPKISHKQNQIHDKTATAWMLRNDGKAFAVAHHTYADPEDREDILLASEWIYGHTRSDTVRQKIVWMLYLWAKSSQMESDAYETLLDYAKESDGFFPSPDFIMEITERIFFLEKRENMKHKLSYEDLLATFDDAAKLLLWQLNQEFLRVRYGGMYDTEKGCKDMIFRISSVGFDWYPAIRRFVKQTTLDVATVTIVRDAEATGMGNSRYFTLNAKNRYDKMKKEAFLKEAYAEAYPKNHLFYLAGTENVRKRACIAGLYEGKSVFEIAGLNTIFLEKLMFYENQLVE